MEPVLRLSMQAFPVQLPFTPRQGMQEKVKDIDRKQGDAIEQERLERIRTDLRIAA